MFSKLIGLILLLLISLYVNPGFCYDETYKLKQEQQERLKDCQSASKGQYLLGSATSPSWLNLEESLCRTQNEYPEYRQARELIKDVTPGAEEMRTLFIVNSLWEKSPLAHTGSLVFNKDNYMKNEPEEILDIKFGTKAQAIPGMVDDSWQAGVIKPRNEVDYTGKRYVEYQLQRKSDFEKAYVFVSRENGMLKSKKVMRLDDPSLKSEIEKWEQDRAKGGFFKRLATDKTKPYEALEQKEIRPFGLMYSDSPYYVFDQNDNLKKYWSYFATEKPFSGGPIEQKFNEIFESLIEKFGEPALKARDGNTKVGIWIGKNGTNITLICKGRNQCGAMSTIQVSKATEPISMTGSDFFK